MCIGVVLAALAAPAPAREAPGGFFKHEAFGYKVRVPKEWRLAALPPDETLIASKHLGKRELEAAKSSRWAREAPEMWVIALSHKGGPAADYRDFVQRQTDIVAWGQGYDFSREKETTVGGVKVTQYEISFANAKRSDEAPRRVVTWVYHFDDFDFAVQFKILDEHYSDYAASFRGCLKSFKRIPRTKALPGAVAEKATDAETTEGEKAELSPEEKKRAREKAIERRFQKEIDDLQDGWKHRRTPGYLVLSNANDKFVRGTITHADAVWAHLGKTFGQATAEPAILRIFATEGEREAYSKGENGQAVTELLVVFGHGYVKDNEYEKLNRDLFSRWCDARHAQLRGSLPRWLADGMEKYMDMVRTKGRKITFANDDWLRDEMRLKITKGDYVPLKQLVEGAGSEDQAKSVVYWLMTKGSRGKYKKLVRSYLHHLLGALTAGAENAARVAREQTFGEWDAKDWSRFTKAWLGHAK
ncbi:MAG: hypothetical protein ACYTG3_08665 [Planctomycetota bacterium]